MSYFYTVVGSDELVFFLNLIEGSGAKLVQVVASDFSYGFGEVKVIEFGVIYRSEVELDL